MAFEVRDDGFTARVAASFARQQAMAHLGMRLSGLGVGRARIEFDYAPALTQQHGYIHAGVLTTALDSACGYAANTLMDAAAGVLTIEFKTNLLRPAKGERFVVDGEVLKPGRTVTVAEAKAHAISGDARTLVASMTATLMSVREAAHG